MKLAAEIEVEQVKKSGRNVLGWLRAGDKPTENIIIIGAHIDHLGKGDSGSSLAKEEEKGGVHRGADDNASGVAGMLEMAQYLAGLKKSGKLKLEHDILFAAWSGEELGLIGSSYFADEFYKLYPNLMPKDPAVAHALGGALYPAVGAAFNLDMIGRLRENLVLQGIGSSSIWTAEIERRNAVVGVPVTLQNDSYLPTDASTFYLKGVPFSRPSRVRMPSTIRRGMCPRRSTMRVQQHNGQADGLDRSIGCFEQDDPRVCFSESAGESGSTRHVDGLFGNGS